MDKHQESPLYIKTKRKADTDICSETSGSRVSLNINQSINQSIHWHVQNAVIPCCSHEPLPFLPVIHFFLPLLSTDHYSILPHFIQPSISWSTSWSGCFQIHIQYSFGNPIFFHSLYMSKPTYCKQYVI